MLCWHFSLLLQLARANRLLSRAAKVNVLYTCCLCVYCLHSNRLIHMFTLLFTLPQFPIFHTEIKLLSHASYDHQTADCAQWLKMWYLDETLTYTSMQTKLYIHIDIAKKKKLPRSWTIQCGALRIRVEASWRSIESGNHLISYQL